MTNPNYKGSENATRIFPEVKVTKTVRVDNDRDPFYESKNTIIYHTTDDGSYAFKANDKGFMITDKDDAKTGSAILSFNKKYYILDIDNYSGIGYFNNDGNFVVEYYDSDSETLINEEFKSDPEF